VTLYIADMAPFLIAKETIDPFDFKGESGKWLFLALLDLIPEIAASIMALDTWPML
jgi:hypothetical protein